MVALLLAGLSASCSKGSDSSLEPVTQCDRAAAVQVSTTVPHVVDWQPKCTAHEVHIADLLKTPGSTIWIYSASDAEFLPPITYGAPSSLFSSAPALVPGKSYLAIVWRRAPPRSGTFYFYRDTAVFVVR
jgi:hypothetical protein